jgi:signal transduction histidine kinase
VLSVAMTLGLAPLLGWRRTHPFAVTAITFGVIAAVDMGLIVADAPALDMYTMVYVLLLAYALFRWGSGREVVAGVAIILVPASISIVVSWAGVAEAVGGMAVLVSAFALGWAVRTQHGAQARMLAQVKSEERIQLARELHDTVAHHVSAIAIQAQAGRALAATSASAPVEALEVIEVEASRTLAEMRTMVRVLRNEVPVDYSPQPGVADLELLSGASPAGLRVEVSRSGDLVGLPSAVDAAVFRIAQEGVTNALRHARHATQIDVHVTADRSTVSLLVRDDGELGAADQVSETGFGITGMVERAALLGGACRAGPGPGGGWTVSATLPRQASA